MIYGDDMATLNPANACGTIILAKDKNTTCKIKIHKTWLSSGLE